MEQIPRKKRKKQNRKPIYLLLGFLIFFAVFIHFITRPSLQTKAIDQIQVCNNVQDVKLLFEKYKFDLLENDENGNKVVANEFQYAVRNKLSSFNLTDDEVEGCLEWLPTQKTSINVIAIPDLSRRIIDSLNNPDQINRDLFVLITIWQAFVNNSKVKQDTRDKFMVDVTDIDQAKGQFGLVANELHFDLSEHKGKSNRLYFTPERDNRFTHSINEMYNSAKQKPLGADYLYYFKRYLINHIKKSTLFDNYVNKVVIITDGYLEAENRMPDTRLSPALYRAADIASISETITNMKLNIPKIEVDLSNTDVLICEVNERRTGREKDFEILKAYWEDWLNRMNARKVSFVPREQATELTKNRIQEFFDY